MRILKIAFVMAVAAGAAGTQLCAARATERVAGAERADPVRVVEITGTDDMKFSVTKITARRGEQIRLRLTSKGTMPKIVMAHNVVVLQLGTNVDKFVAAGAQHRATDFIAPALLDRVIAKTAMAGPGETVQVIFKAPAKPGSYPFLCTFAGHYQSGMKGVLVVR
jgi:azurin